jgi:ferric iron reductase protein FhuF
VAVFDLTVDTDQVTASGMRNDDAFLCALTELCEHMVDRLHARSGLAKAALWRILGDSLAGAFLANGKELGCADAAQDIALPLLRRRGTPFFSRQTGFTRIALPEAPEIHGSFRVRGGCCRYYTLPDGEYCTTCVLRDDKSRTARLTEYLRDTRT